MPAEAPVNGYILTSTRAAIEGFLALYGDRDRYAGDDPGARRRDAEIAAGRLRLLPSDGGGVLITAVRTDARAELSILGFLETYERNSDQVHAEAVERLRHALPMFLTRADNDSN